MDEPSSRGPRGSDPAGVSPVLATVFATVGFFALAVFGLGALSVATDTDIISAPGLGQGPGVGGMLGALVAFAGLLLVALRRRPPSFSSAAVIAVCAALAHLVVVWIVTTSVTASFLLATAVAGDLVRGGTSAVLLVAAGIAACGGIAMRRAGAGHPRWPWERDSEG